MNVNQDQDDNNQDDNEAKYHYGGTKWSRDELDELKDKVKEDYPGRCHVYTGGTVRDNSVPGDVTTVIIGIDTLIIAVGAFQGMKRVIFHDNITEIGERAFAYSGLEGKVVIPKKVTKIEDGTFARCPKLKSVVLHDGIRSTDIGACAFICSGRKGKVVIKRRHQQRVTKW